MRDTEKDKQERKYKPVYIAAEGDDLIKELIPLVAEKMQAPEVYGDAKPTRAGVVLLALRQLRKSLEPKNK